MEHPIERRQHEQVSSVALMMPPMTTVASGLCTSAPGPCERHRHEAERATSAVMSTGRSRVSAPS